jgi:hypothetical protein
MRVEISKLVALWEKRFAQPLTQWGVSIRRSERHDEKTDYYVWRVYPNPLDKKDDFHYTLVIAKLKPSKILIENQEHCDVFSETEIANIWSAFFQRAREIASEALLIKLTTPLILHNIIPEIYSREITFLNSDGQILRLSFIFSGHNCFILKDRRGVAVKIEPTDIKDLAQQIVQVCSLMLL